jgi:hypothetical protein
MAQLRQSLRLLQRLQRVETTASSAAAQDAKQLTEPAGVLHYFCITVAKYTEPKKAMAAEDASTCPHQLHL